MTRSTRGSYLVAIREDDLLAEALGIDVTRYRVLAFFISSLFAGVGGAFMPTTSVLFRPAASMC